MSQAIEESPSDSSEETPAVEDNTLQGGEPSSGFRSHQGSAQMRASTAVHLRTAEELDTIDMGFRQRVTAKAKYMVRNAFPGPKNEVTKEGDDDIEETQPKKKQYRLGPQPDFSGLWRRGPGSLSPNRSLAISLHWMFRVNFLFLFLASCAVFFAFTVFFAAIIIGVGRRNPECVRVGGEEFESAGRTFAFADAFALSWTTFSTVGYGSTYPALSSENGANSNCLFITAICSLESFIGVLYSGFCGAILFGKVLRLQSHAQVIFSDPIVIRYGSGVDHRDGERAKNIPCPVLEFRVVNRLFHEKDGEIMDASLNVVARVDADDMDLTSASNSLLPHPPDDSPSSSIYDASTDSMHQNQTERSLQSLVSNLMRRRQPEDHHMLSKRIFSKVIIEASDHPFFRRVWLARHILDETSPLLMPAVRREVRRLGGYWPEHLNNYSGVKSSLEFNQIIVSLNGVANVSASDVYAQKIYEIVDVNVGYQFVNILYRDGDTLKVDTDLVNDVREQHGGGGEPLLDGE